LELKLQIPEVTVMRGAELLSYYSVMRGSELSIIIFFNPTKS